MNFVLRLFYLFDQLAFTKAKYLYFAGQISKTHLEIPQNYGDRKIILMFTSDLYILLK